MEKIFIQATNKERDIKAILDGYHALIPHNFYLAEALQKDAIQNSWDARIDKVNGSNWKCSFGLLRAGQNVFFTITDEGTKGLIGTQFSDQKELMTILRSETKGEDLATFCSLNWSVKKDDEGGNRGRGKVVFLGASEDKKIYFDSYRSTDNRHVMVELYVNQDKEVEYKIVWDKDANEKISKISNNIMQPLDVHGTRIIISNPNKKIVEAMKQGYLLAYINNTWWEIIKKYNANITINDGIISKKAFLSEWYENKEDIKVKVAEKIIPMSSFSSKDDEFIVDKLVLRYTAERDIPSNIKGIAVQRGGMTIERLKMDDLLREAGTNNVYGWIEMGKNLSQEMKNNCERPEHFSFIWNKKPAKYLFDYIRTKCREFAKDLELIEDEHTKKNKMQKIAALNATNFLTPLFQKLKLSGGGGKTPRKRKGKLRNRNEKLRLSTVDFELPNDNNRVNHGQEIKGAYVVPINEYDRNFFVSIKVWLETEDEKIIIEEREINLAPGEGPKIGAETYQITKKLKKGKYVFKAQMLSLEETDFIIQIHSIAMRVEKGTPLYDRVNKTIYIEMDPPDTGPFDFQPQPSDDKRKLIWHEVNEIDDSLVIKYNNKHPKILPLSSSDDPAPLTEYLISQGAALLYQIKIENLLEQEDDGFIDEIDEDLLLILKSKRIDKIFPYILERQSEILWGYLNI